MNFRTFNNPDNGDVRVFVGSDGIPLFVGKDIAAAVGFTNTSNAISKYCKHAKLAKELCEKAQKMRLISTSDIGRLVFRSRSKNAIGFYDWIYEVVIPKLDGTTSVVEDIKEKKEDASKQKNGWQEQTRNKEQVSQAELIMRLAKANLDNERRIVVLEKNVEEVLNVYDYSKNIDQYSTIAGYIRRFNLPILVSQYSQYGLRATDICKRRGVIVSKISDVRYGTINLYPNFILQELFKDYFSK